MKNNEIDIHEVIVKNYVESIRPEELEIRKELDFGYSYDGQNFEIFEIRPQYDKPEEILHTPCAKITFVKSKRIWKIYWMRGNLKWDLYEEFPSQVTLENVLQVVNEDKHGCFYG